MILKFKYYLIGILFLIGYTLFLSVVLKTKEVIIKERIVREVEKQNLEKKIEIPIKKLEVYKKGITKEIVLPNNLIQFPSDYIVATTSVKSDETYNHSITTFVDADSGKVTTYDVKEPLPWVAFNRRGRVSSYGIIKNNVFTSKTEVVGEFMQIKELHLGIVAGYDKPIFDKTVEADMYIGVGGWINF